MNLQKSLITAIFLLSVSLVTHVHAQLIRSVDGSNNNLDHPGFGAVDQPVRIMTSLDYSNGINSPAGWDRANVRSISNALFSEIENPADQHGLTNMVWVFGKFIEQDISFFEQDPDDKVYLDIPKCDPFFDPDCSKNLVLAFSRLKAIEGTGNSLENPRNVANSNTAWIDASMIYGCDEATAAWLRTGVDGKLKMSEGGMLPFNTVDGELNGAIDPDAPNMQIVVPGTQRYFVAGNPRINDNLAILSLHTLFVREHNRICDELLRQSPGYDDEGLYQKARSLVAGLIQNIVYHEWLPALGIDVGEYRGYSYFVDPAISNEFITAGFKIWNTLMPEQYVLTDDFCEPHPMGNLSFNDMMYNPLFILKTNLAPILKGLVNNRQQNMDPEVIDEIRNFDYHRNDFEIRTDFVSTDILRGRDRGVPDYNALRIQLGLDPCDSFADITEDQAIQNALAEVYNNDINNIDAWVGMAVEDHIPGTMMGETMQYLWMDQFERLRRGDRFYFENDPLITRSEEADIKQTTLADIVVRNSDLNFLQENVFSYDPQCLEFETTSKHLGGQVFPNPVSDEMNLSVNSDEEGSGRVIVLDPLGNIVSESGVELIRGHNLIRSHLDTGLPPGLYVVQVIQANSTGVFKFIKAN